MVSLVTILNHTSKDVHQNVATKVGIEDGIDAVKLSMVDQFNNREWVLIASCDHTDSVDEEEGAEEGSRLNEDVIIEEEGEHSKDEGHSNHEAPITHLAVTDKFVDTSVVGDEAKCEAAPAGETEGSELGEFLEDEAENEADEDGSSKDCPDNPGLRVLFQEGGVEDVHDDEA